MLKQSTSGGAFFALSEQFLLDGNAVICAEYDYSQNKVQFKVTATPEERNRARGTKYVQADMGMVYKDAVEWLQSHPEKRIMFFGLGCQAAAFLNFM